jgi:MFS family permease
MMLLLHLTKFLTVVVSTVLLVNHNTVHGHTSSGIAGNTALMPRIHQVLAHLTYQQENYIIQRVPIAKWLSGNIILWGVALSLQAAMKNFEGLIALRAFLGLFEAASQPTFTLLSSMWYTREEQGAAVTFWCVSLRGCF